MKRILVCDDDHEIVQAICVYLTDAGFEIVRAYSGKEALQCVLDPDQQIDLIIMDVMMPVRDGHEATRAIRAMDRPDAKTIPIFAMTANAFTEDRRKALESGMNEHLSKPIDPDALYRLLVKYLTERS